MGALNIAGLIKIEKKDDVTIVHNAKKPGIVPGAPKGLVLEYIFHVLDPEGKFIKKIVKDYNQIKMNDEEKEKMMKERWGDEPPPPGFKIVFPKNFPPMYYFLCGDNGRIYVRTYEQDSQAQIKWDVFDEEGRYILSFFHPEQDILFVIKNNKAYSMILENEEGIPVVKRYRMEWK